MLVAYVSIVYGLLLFFPELHPQSVDDALDHPRTTVTWALLFVAGGISKAYGLSVTTAIFDNRHPKRLEWGKTWERVGASLIALCFTIYAAVALAINGMAAMLPASLFIAIAVTNLIRLVISVAGRAVGEEFIRVSKGD
jgi:hypothetical protein